ncbi:MAG TPA: PilW family protein [Thiobacillaceae bacterium]|nr:PilW family protein [Thiobacillaceae bacterium]HNU65225.1 PilW family protein [Thiobacillaceae bacterium]
MWKVRTGGSSARQRGMSLVELLVAMGLGLLLVVGIGTIYLGSRQTYRMQEANARLQETGRFALEVVGRSLRQAGADANITANVAAVTTECLPTATPACTPIGGTDNSTNGTSADTMTVQYYAGQEQPDSDGDGVRESRNCLGNVANADQMVTETYDLSGDNLRCTATVGAAAAQVQPLVANIEDLQIVYGVDSDGDQSANSYTATPTAGQWPNVVTARVCVMARSTETGLARSGQRPWDCPRLLGTAAGQPAAIADTRLHRAFVATYNLRNRISNLP